ncbi:MAG: Rab proteins geranylgeranyltransferase component A [Phylliscum demangeonii]|nr:MAG: Rab proteins geranylgeranyltransferase component A [Phylliscum demangeonii]
MTTESVEDTAWDVLISGTGLPQSLLALALSRSKLNVLHLDRNNYYGAFDAAFSLQEADTWVKDIQDESSCFRDASVLRHDVRPPAAGEPVAELSFPRAYSLSLSPQIIYTRSSLLAALVSSKVYRQLEFQAIGSWWILDLGTTSTDVTGNPAFGEDGSLSADRGPASLKRVPGGREDVFKDGSIDLRSKRLLMKFLKFAADYENQTDVWEAHASIPFTDFLSSQFHLPPELHVPLLAISMSSESARKTSTAVALQRITRHLRSIGRFGPGFGAVVPKWGGAAEIAQVACRAGAVGGTVYMLGNDIEGVREHTGDGADSSPAHIQLRNGEKLKARWVAQSTPWRPMMPELDLHRQSDGEMVKSISIVSSPLTSLFTTTAEGGPQPAGAVVFVPQGGSAADIPPVHIIAHSSETGECPAGQCVLYASVRAHAATGFSTLETSVQRLLEAVDGNSSAQVLYTLRYQQLGPPSAAEATQPQPPALSCVREFDAPSLDLVFDDDVLEQVRQAWCQIRGKEGGSETTGGEASSDEFMVFDDRDGIGGNGDGDGDGDG